MYRTPDYKEITQPWMDGCMAIDARHMEKIRTFVLERRPNICLAQMSSLTCYTPECNSSILHNYTSTRQRAGKLLHI